MTLDGIHPKSTRIERFIRQPLRRVISSIGNLGQFRPIEIGRSITALPKPPIVQVKPETLDPPAAAPAPVPPPGQRHATISAMPAYGNTHEKLRQNLDKTQAKIASHNKVFKWTAGFYGALVGVLAATSLVSYGHLIIVSGLLYAAYCAVIALVNSSRQQTARMAVVMSIGEPSAETVIAESIAKWVKNKAGQSDEVPQAELITREIDKFPFGPMPFQKDRIVFMVQAELLDVKTVSSQQVAALQKEIDSSHNPGSLVVLKETELYKRLSQALEAVTKREAAEAVEKEAWAFADDALTQIEKNCVVDPQPVWKTALKHLSALERLGLKDGPAYHAIATAVLGNLNALFPIAGAPAKVEIIEEASAPVLPWQMPALDLTEPNSVGSFLGQLNLALLEGKITRDNYKPAFQAFNSIVNDPNLFTNHPWLIEQIAPVSGGFTRLASAGNPKNG